jgi:hypothetical protein
MKKQDNKMICSTKREKKWSEYVKENLNAKKRQTRVEESYVLLRIVEIGGSGEQ